jgi:hypothetical protein
MTNPTLRRHGLSDRRKFFPRDEVRRQIGSIREGIEHNVS